jgi:TP901 family phage tail tape measure protein
MTVLARARVILEGDAVQLTRTLQGASAAMTQAGAKMTRMGRQLSLRVTAPLLAIGGAAVKMGADFEAEMQKIVGLVGVAQDQVDAWGQDILDMAPRLGAAPRELAEGLFFVTSAGFRGAEAMEVLEQAGKASAAGLGEIATVADAVTSAINAYGQENLSAGRATDILTAAVREGKLEAESLTPVLGRLLPTAAAMGIEFDQVAGSLAVFSRTGTDAAQGATSLQAIMTTLQKPTKQSRDLIEGAGLSMAGLREVAAGPGGLIQVLRLLEGAFGDNDEALAQIFPNVRAFRGVMNALAQDAEAVDSVMSGVTNSTGAADHAFETAADTARFRMKQALVEVQVVLLRLADIVLPIVADAVEKVGRGIRILGNGFADLPRGMQVTIVGLFGVAAAAGPVLLIVGQLTIALAALGKAFVALKITTAISAFVGWGKAVASLAVGVRSLSAALALLKVAIGPAGWLIAGLGLAASAAGVWLSRTREANRVAREAAERVDAYATALAGWTQEAREAEKVRLDEALSRQRDELQKLRDEAAEARQAVRGAPPAERLAARERIQEADRAVENQRKLVQRLEADYDAVTESIEATAAAGAGLEIPDFDFDLDLNLPGADEVAEALDQLKADLRAAEREAAVLRDAFDLGSAQADAYRTAVASLASTSAGLDDAVGSNGETIRDIAGAYLAAEEAATKNAEAQRKAKEQTEAVEQASRGLADRLAQNAALNDLLGGSFDQTSADADAYGQAVRTLVERGVELDTVVGQNGETLGELADTYLDLSAEVRQAADEQARYNALVSDGQRVAESVRTPLEEYHDTVRRLDLMLVTVDESTGRAILSQEQHARAVEAAAERYRDATSELGALEQQMVLTATAGVDAFAMFATGAGDAMRQFVQRALQDLARLIARMLVARAIMAAFPGVGFAVSVAGALDPTALARGGRFRRHEPILVGEEGPELIFPQLGGRVFSAPDTARMLGEEAARTVGGGRMVVGAAGAASGGTLSLDASSLPPRPAMMTPDAVATDDWWRRAFSHLKMDHDDRGGL